MSLSIGSVHRQEDVLAKLHHTNIRVVDIDGTLRFYAAFGFESRGFMNLGYAHVVYLGLPDDAGLLELAIGIDVDDSWATSPGSGHIALTVEDLRKEVDRLNGIGIAPDSEPFNPGGREGLLVCFFTDPNGHRLELIEGPFRLPDDPPPSQIRRYLKVPTTGS